jgi:hypothetical protein
MKGALCADRVFPESHLIPVEPDPRLLANLMLSNGAEKHLEDWTIFFLNQTPFSMIAPVLAFKTPDREERSVSNSRASYTPSLLSRVTP